MIKSMTAFLWGMIMFGCVMIMTATLPYVVGHAWPELTYMADQLGWGPDHPQMTGRIVAIFLFLVSILLAITAGRRRALMDDKWLMVLRDLRASRGKHKGYRSRARDVMAFFFSARGVASRGEFAFGIFVLGSFYLLLLNAMGAAHGGVMTDQGIFIPDPANPLLQPPGLILAHLSAFLDILFPLTMMLPLMIRRFRDIGGRFFWLCLIVAWPWLYALSETLRPLLEKAGVPLWPFSYPMMMMRYVTPGWLLGGDHLFTSWLISWCGVMLLAAGNAARYAQPPFGMAPKIWQWVRPVAMVLMMAGVTIGGRAAYLAFSTMSGYEWSGFERDPMAGQHRLLADIQRMRNGLQRYYQDLDAVPDSLAALSGDASRLGWSGPYVTLPLGIGDYQIEPEQLLLMHGRFDKNLEFHDCRFDQLHVPLQGHKAECGVWLVVMKATPQIINTLAQLVPHPAIQGRSMVYVLLSREMPDFLERGLPLPLPLQPDLKQGPTATMLPVVDGLRKKK